MKSSDREDPVWLQIWAIVEADLQPQTFSERMGSPSWEWVCWHQIWTPAGADLLPQNQMPAGLEEGSLGIRSARFRPLSPFMIANNENLDP